MLDVAGAAAQLFAYDAYGQAIGFNPADALTEFLYSGEQFDAKIGQQYLRARYYDPATGRFNRNDPFFGNLTDPQSLHNYLYAHCDPINGFDPNGELAIFPILALTAIFFFAFAQTAHAPSKAIVFDYPEIDPWFGNMLGPGIYALPTTKTLNIEVEVKIHSFANISKEKVKADIGYANKLWNQAKIKFVVNDNNINYVQTAGTQVHFRSGNLPISASSDGGLNNYWKSAPNGKIVIHYVAGFTDKYDPANSSFIRDVTGLNPAGTRSVIISTGFNFHNPFRWNVTAHELGHALGLTHPDDDYGQLMNTSTQSWYPRLSEYECERARAKVEQITNNQ